MQDATTTARCLTRLAELTSWRLLVRLAKGFGGRLGGMAFASEVLVFSRVESGQPWLHCCTQVRTLLW